MVSQFDHDLSQWLTENAEPNEMILPAIYPRSELQVKTGHPVLVDFKTLHLMTYMPNLAERIGFLTRDLFGVDFSDRDQLSRIADDDGHFYKRNPEWLEAWKKRNTEEWQMLGRKYGFRLVVSPTKSDLDLPAALEGSLWTLYVIPI